MLEEELCRSSNFMRNFRAIFSFQMCAAERPTKIMAASAVSPIMSTQTAITLSFMGYNECGRPLKDAMR